MDEQAVDPGVESVRIAKSRQFTPGDHQRLLYGIFGSTNVPEDPVGNRKESIRRRAGKDGKRLPVPSLCQLDKVAIHHAPSLIAPKAERVQCCLSRFAWLPFNVRRQRNWQSSCPRGP